MGRKGFFLVVFVVVTLFAGAFAFSPSKSKLDTVAEFQVSNLTCGACAEKILAAVRSLDAAAEVEVEVASGRAQVMFDGERTDAAAIAAQITRAGYPAVASSPGYEAKASPVVPSAGCPAAKPVKKSGCGGGCCG